MAELKVGDKVWVFNQNRRVYPETTKDRYHSGPPIWREHWEEKVVAGENRASFFIGNLVPYDPRRASLYQKVSKADIKADRRLHWLALSKQEVDRRAWMNGSRFALVERIRSCEDYDVLVQVAELVAPDLKP